MNVRAWARATPGACALVFGSQRWTWRELDAEVAHWTARLTSQGVRAGDRVAVLARNRAEVVFLIHAVARLGATLVPLNARLRPAELAPLIALTQPQLVLAEDALADRIAGALSLERVSASLPDLHLAVEPLPQAWGQSSTLMFTSGTTGVAKAAHLTRANIDAHLRAWDADFADAGRTRCWLGCLPLFHVGGRAMVERCAAFGGTLILHEGFDSDAVARVLREEPVHRLSLVPTTLAWLLEADRGAAPPQLRSVLVGGSQASPALLELAHARGYPVLHTYGLTEACSQVCTERPGEADGQTAGRTLLGVEVRMVDADGATGSEGEIEVRGPTVIREYFRNAEATRAAFREGWLRTRDLGRLDERGRLSVLGRRHDLIVSGGENVYPAEVEAVLCAHPGIAEVAVLGLPDATWGAVPVALGVARAGEPGNIDVERWCRERLAGFKVPRRCAWVDALPRNAGGKLDRAALARLWDDASDGGLRGRAVPHPNPLPMAGEGTPFPRD